MVLQSHAHHLGSLLRPPSLINARKLRASGYITENEYQVVESNAVSSAVRLQIKAGFSCVNNGEYARDNFWEGFYSSLAGFQFSSPPPLQHFRPYLPWGQILATTGSEPGEHRNRSMICKGKIRHVKSAYVQELRQLQNLLVDHPNIEIKMTIISPTWHHIRYRSGRAYDQSPYTNDSEYFSDVVAAYQEIAVLYSAGLRNIQIDAPELSLFCDNNIRAAFKGDGQDPDILLHTYIEVLNQCVAKTASDLHVGLHISPEIFESSCFAISSYDRIARAMFENVNVDTFYMEYGDDYSGGFQSLQYLPENKNVVLGLIASKFSKMENLEEIKAKVFAAAELVAKAQGNRATKKDALKRMGISPNCGFASHYEDSAIKHQDMVTKLNLVQDLAEEIWSSES